MHEEDISKGPAIIRFLFSLREASGYWINDVLLATFVGYLAPQTVLKLIILTNIDQVPRGDILPASPYQNSLNTLSANPTMSSTGIPAIRAASSYMMTAMSLAFSLSSAYAFLRAA